jgi:poly-gamma-glutamate synthesis protein (capsule biosynthesis protein)
MLRPTAIAAAALMAACGQARAEPPAATPTSVTTIIEVTTPTAIEVSTTAPPPVATTTSSPPAETPRGRLVIHAVGDVNFAPNSTVAFTRDGFDIAWNGLRGIFKLDHLTIVNFECSPTQIGIPIEKEWTFRCPLDSLAPMRVAGVEVTSLANNHAGDLGKSALVDGRENLIAAGFHAVGAGRDLDEANRPAIIEIEGWRIAVVGLSSISGDTGWFATDRGPGVAPASLGNITASVSAAAEISDIVIVMVHWGLELTSQPTRGDRLRADAMIAAGADVIVGHHPHRLQPLEIVDGVPVFWSMGNFVWPYLSHTQSVTAVAEIVIEPDGSVIGRLIPAYIESHGHPELRGSPDPSLVPERTAAD